MYRTKIQRNNLLFHVSMIHTEMGQLVTPVWQDSPEYISFLLVSFCHTYD